MLTVPGRGNTTQIVILNPKGGCGKTTLSTNLACYFAARGDTTVITDCDSQGSSTQWLEKRPSSLPKIHSIAAYKNNMQTTRSWQLRVPNGTRIQIIDCAASLSRTDLCDVTRDASCILIPILPSAIDIRAAVRCIADLFLIAKVNRREGKLAVIANRTRKNTKSYARLMRFLNTLEIPIIAEIRDSQNFVYAAEEGIGVCEMQPSKVSPDVEQITRIANWIDALEEHRQTHLKQTAATQIRELAQAEI